MAQNMAVIDELIQEILVTISGGAVDAFTVKCTTNDTTASFLHDALTFTSAGGTYDVNADPVITSETDTPSGNETESLFIDASAVPGYSGTGTWALCEVNGVLTFVDGSTLGSGGGDNFKVKVSGADTTDQYLHAKFKDSATYSATADAIVGAAITDAAGDENVRMFLDGSGITGYGSIPDGETWPLVMARVGSAYTIQFSDTFTGGGADAYTAGDYIDIVGTEISVDMTEIADFTAGHDEFLMHYASGAEKWERMEGFDVTKIQMLGHVNGAWKLMQVADWLNLMTGYAVGSDQSIGHDANAATIWQTDVECP